MAALLCDELVTLILLELERADRAQASAVCHSWRRATPQLLSRCGAPCRVVVTGRHKVNVDVACPHCLNRVDTMPVLTRGWAAFACGNARCGVCCVAAIGSVDVKLDGLAAMTTLTCSDGTCCAEFEAPLFSTKVHFLEPKLRRKAQADLRARKAQLAAHAVQYPHVHDIRKLMRLALPGRSRWVV
eukprot:6119273-Prymnesium_polylepis.1